MTLLNEGTWRAPPGSTWPRQQHSGSTASLVRCLSSYSHPEDTGSPSWVPAGPPPSRGLRKSLELVPACPELVMNDLFICSRPSRCLAGRGLEGAAGSWAGHGGGLAHQSFCCPSSFLPPFQTCGVLEQAAPLPSSASISTLSCFLHS